MQREKAAGKTTTKCIRTTKLEIIETIVTKRTRTKKGLDHQNDRNASAEDRDTGDKSDTSGKHDRNESRSENDDKKDQSGSESGKSRDDSQRQNSDSNSNSSGIFGEDDDSHHHSGRHVQQFEQRRRRRDSAADSSPADSTNDHPDTTQLLRQIPMYVIDHVPSHVDQRSGGERKRPRYRVRKHRAAALPSLVPEM